jgi:hypothetical protein
VNAQLSRARLDEHLAHGSDQGAKEYKQERLARCGAIIDR